MSILHVVAAFLCTGFTILKLRPIAGKFGLLDIPGGRKTHISATPLVGGLGIFIGVLLVSLSIPTLVSGFAPLLILSALVLFIGTIDDIKDLKPNIRMLGHVLVVLAMAVIAEVQIQSFGDILFMGSIDLNLLVVPVTVFAAVGVINAVNMSDGIDGLSGGLVVITLGCLCILALLAGRIDLANFCTLLICTIFAFLSLNFRRPWNKKALVYLGDAGSTMLGFIVAWLLIDASQGQEPLFAPVYALWFFAVPLFDTVNLLFKRPMRGLSPFRPGTDHLHHALLSRGLSATQVVALLLFVSVLFASVGMAGLYFNASESVMFSLFLGLFTVYFLTAELLVNKRIAVSDKA